VSPVRTRSKEVDEACAAAVDLAQAAATEVAGPGQVGEHVGLQADADRVVTHLFACLDPAYVGWRWAVTVARASRAKVVTVDECVLLPGPDSLLAPEWVPWSERVRPGDLGVGDLMPAATDDERLVPVASLEGDDGVLEWGEDSAWEEGSADRATSLGFADLADLADLAGPQSAPARPLAPGQSEGEPVGRSRVLSAIGRDAAALRWYSSDHGPGTPLAHAAPGPCLTCGFMVRLAGPLGRVFGACANEYAPDDGRVVSLDHGCGAHSESAGATPIAGAQLPVIDEMGYDLVDTAGVSMADTVFETLDHGASEGRSGSEGR
jgi:Protein of unknown function (DUF3027)